MQNCLPSKVEQLFHCGRNVFDINCLFAVAAELRDNFWKVPKVSEVFLKKNDCIHANPCKEARVGMKVPEEYVHSSARYYYTGIQGIYPVITYMELQDIDLR